MKVKASDLRPGDYVLFIGSVLHIDWLEANPDADGIIAHGGPGDIEYRVDADVDVLRPE